MRLHRLIGKKGYTTFGCMWAKGECFENTEYILENEGGTAIPVQSRITAYWPDGSVKWTAHTADAALMGEKVEIKKKDAATENESDKQSCSGIKITRRENGFEIDNGILIFDIDDSGECLVSSIVRNGTKIAENLCPELILSTPIEIDGNDAIMDVRYSGKIRKVEIEESGNLMCIVKYTGTHVNKENDEKIRYIIRMKVYMNSSEIKFVHSFIYDGEPEKDYLKGLGIVFDTRISGEMYNRHVKFETDNGVFHESAVTLVSWRPRVPEGLYEDQMAGRVLNPTGKQLNDVDEIMKAIPFWNTYDLCQDTDSHFMIRKKLLGKNLCYIDSLNGNHAKGGMNVGALDGCVAVAMRDFWEKYPSGYTVSGLTQDKASCHIWLWSPTARPMDFRHYAERGYNSVCYEGYDYKGADPYGIACTNEFTIGFYDKMILSDEELSDFSKDTNEGTLYVADPREYHELRAFGYWSLPKFETELQKKLEEELSNAFDFYKKEVEQRKWYGMFNYGDFMHTYDSVRHVWRYDVGGYAWDNTELVPTLWLWYYFLRTGRADVFKLAEKLTRHTSEVDVYHIGKYKGMGSRHNVIHWGCPCKEARIAMAGHHRFYYYLTGDRRLEDIFDELKDNEKTFLNRDPLGDFYPKEEMVEPSHARSGPDWSSLCSNWMTEWERKNDASYMKKIEVGSEDIKNAPLKLVSGPDFEFNPNTLHLRYIGEKTTGGTHLQICMGAPSIWMEMADLLEDDEWKDMLAEYGRFYFLPRTEMEKESNGLIGNRQFTIPMFATGIGAYGAKRLNDDVLAERVWKTLLDAQYTDCSEDGFKPMIVENAGNMAHLSEIPWISTNHVAQFCLNTIMVMEFLKK